MKRVCIVTTGQIGSNPRVLKEAQALHIAGYAVEVIATRVPGRLEMIDSATFLWHLTLLDLRSKWRWRFLRAEQVFCALIERLLRYPRLADLGLSAFTRPLVTAAIRIPADLYIAHYPPALAAAAAAARRNNARYAYDAEDFHLGDLPDVPAFKFQRRLIRSVESRYLPGCSYVTAASPMIADAYAAEYGIRRPNVLLNVFPKAQAPRCLTPRGTGEFHPSVYWFSQTVGPDRGLECAVLAIAMARTKPHLVLRGSMARQFGDLLVTLAHKAGAADRLHFLPPAPASDMERLAAIHDIGLVGETGHTLNRRIALTNKQFSYLLAGIPTVMSDIPAHRAFAADCAGAAFLYTANDAASLAAALDFLLESPERLAQARAAAFRLAQDQFNWDREQHVATASVAAALETVQRSFGKCHAF